MGAIKPEGKSATSPSPSASRAPTLSPTPPCCVVYAELWWPRRVEPNAKATTRMQKSQTHSNAVTFLMKRGVNGHLSCILRVYHVVATKSDFAFIYKRIHLSQNTYFLKNYTNFFSTQVVLCANFKSACKQADEK